MERRITVRYFLFPPEGGLRRLSGRVIEGLVHGTDRVPQYAGQRLRIAYAVVILAEGKPLRLGDVHGAWVEVDARGLVRTGVNHTDSDIIGSPHLDFEAVDCGSNIVAAQETFARRAQARWRWTPTPAEITAIVHTIWPEAAGRKMKLPPYESGASKRRYPVTEEAEKAASKCSRHIRKLRSAIDVLSDQDLKGILSRVEEESQIIGQGTEHLWRGLGGLAEWMLKARRARTSPKGTWYVSVDMLVREGDEPWVTFDMKRLENIVCKGRAEAEAAYRACWAKYAGRFTYDTKFEIEICPEIEWDGVDVDGDEANTPPVANDERAAPKPEPV
jgi:hypothetical protein